ncbi:large subunit ribosomal protein L4 [Catalinimonas alkaloidigena]|uniref:Large ribosomal subunit protein uL4 n=1 Tax=Catalinimonas alkaloidigena TaxID=1075417 RepID=A0A1G9Q7U7_9BACT|nr:50S ribosomal protein L4 [Catalinimonas alkaloidigena]SDM07019.1 large subunit ribosomal protein L4 [Catalinimonas alkaloidigena]
MELPVLNIDGKETGRTVTLPQGVFGIEPSEHAVYLDVKQYLANQRQGTHKSKERAEIAGSTKKIKRQKGTGGARAGSLKSPVFVGGGRIFGPRPRNYSFKLNKKVKALARRSALAQKALSESITVLEKPTLDKPSTKQFATMLSNLSVGSGKTLFILGDLDKNLILSGRNLAKSKVTTVSHLNTYEVMNADRIILSEEAIGKFEELLNK